MRPHVKSMTAIIVLLVTTTVATTQDKLGAGEILHRHLDSIAAPATLAAAKSRVIEATSVYRVLVGGTGEVAGKAVFVSDGNKLHILLKINAPQFTGEQFIRDGDKTSVAATYQDKSRSEFGTFLRGEDAPLREGLLGGVLTTDWPLLDLDAHKSKIHYLGLKNVDGSDLHAVAYQPRKGANLDITLYFDPQTFRHVRTVYTANQNVGLGQGGQNDAMAPPSEIARTTPNGADVNSARQQQTRYRIEERFSDFKTVDGFTLPSHYDLRYQEELQNGFTKVVEWEVTTTRVLNNIPVDARNFQIH